MECPKCRAENNDTSRFCAACAAPLAPGAGAGPEGASLTKTLETPVRVLRPIAYIAARKWLEPFAYRVGLDIWMFAAAAVLALLVAGLTMSWHALRAARAEPARSLRYE